MTEKKNSPEFKECPYCGSPNIDKSGYHGPGDGIIFKVVEDKE